MGHRFVILFLCYLSCFFFVIVVFISVCSSIFWMTYILLFSFRWFSSVIPIIIRIMSIVTTWFLPIVVYLYCYYLSLSVSVTFVWVFTIMSLSIFVIVNIIISVVRWMLSWVTAVCVSWAWSAIVVFVMIIVSVVTVSSTPV